MSKLTDYCPNGLENKILVTVEYLNQQGLYPTSLGIYKILKGVVDEETKPLINCPTFSVIISIPKKRISLKVSMLLRYGFLENKYSKEKDMMVLSLSMKGKSYLSIYYKKRNKKFVKKTANTEISIIKL